MLFFFKRTQKSGTKTLLQSANFQAGRASYSSSVTSDNPSQVPRVYSVSYTYFLQHLPRSLLYPGRNTHFLKQRSPRFQKGGQAHPAPVEPILHFVDIIAQGIKYTGTTSINPRNVFCSFRYQPQEGEMNFRFAGF